MRLKESSGKDRVWGETMDWVPNSGILTTVVLASIGGVLGPEQSLCFTVSDII